MMTTWRNGSLKMKEEDGRFQNMTSIFRNRVSAGWMRKENHDVTYNESTGCEYQQQHLLSSVPGKQAHLPQASSSHTNAAQPTPLKAAD